MHLVCSIPAPTRIASVAVVGGNNFRPTMFNGFDDGMYGFLLIKYIT